MNNPKSKKVLSPKQGEKLLRTLRERFEKNMNRHKSLKWAEIEQRLVKHAGNLWSLQEMERTGGEPDIVGRDNKSGEFIFFDCSTETPSGRVSLCYDAAARKKRKENKPRSSAMEMAGGMGVELLTELRYRRLQEFGEFDSKTSSWVRTPDDIRNLGGALFCDRRFGHVFVYHNGAQSYYAARGFRGSLNI